jgi:general secretion pathway protein G
MICTRSHRGFTLIEIIIAIAIVAFMMTASTIAFRAFQKRGQITSTKSTLKNTNTAISSYKMFAGVYPKSLRELTEKPSDPKLSSKWPGKLLEKEPEDAWGQPLRYQLTPGKEHPYELYSDGDPDDPQRINVWDI